MRSTRQRTAATTGCALAALAFATLIPWPGMAQTAKPVITRSWTSTRQTSVGVNATTTAKPVIVRNLDGADRQTILTNFWTHMSGGLGDGGGGCGSGFAIPDGGVLVIELISVKMITSSAGQGAYVAIGATKSGSLGTQESEVSAIHLGLQPQGQHYAGPSATAYHYVAVQPVRLRLTKDDWLCESLYGGTGGATGSVHFSYFGYILPAP